MADPEHVELVKRGAEAIEEWREKNPDVQLDLSGADLMGANLSRADLSGANFSGAHLGGADLIRADLSGAHLSGADLSGANLSGADLSRADLSGADLIAADLGGADLGGADLSRADLSGGNLSEANLSGADLSEARLLETIFANVDLRAVKNLETVKHSGPSYISTDTLYKSQGKIPESFLRGCGVPDNLIEYLPSLIGGQQAIQFYSCFISYSSQDEEFCKRLHARMQQEKLRVWFAPEDMKGGKKIHEQIDEAIRLHDKLLLVVSDSSMDSKWVRVEMKKALLREQREGKRVLFPIRLVPFKRLEEWEAFYADIVKDMAEEVREYFVRDFSEWKDHDKFEAAFARLLKDLTAAT